MKSRFISSFAVVLTVLFCALSMTNVNAQCDYTLEMNDSYGDGWNGNTVSVLINGAVVLPNIGITGGSQGTQTFTVNTGDQITTVWNGGGSYGYETSYRILDVNGSEVGSGAESSISSAITAACPSCQQPTSPGAAGVTASTTDYYFTDGSGNGATEWEVSYGPNGFVAGNGTEFVATSTNTGLSGLSPNTSYDIYVRAICGVGDTSGYSVVTSITTLCSTIAAPYTMTFDNTSTPSCWTNAGDESWSWQTGSGFGAAAYASTPGGGDHTGNSGAFAALDGSGTNPTSGSFATLTSPNIDLTGLTTPRLRFYVFSNNTNNPGDNATFYAIVSGTTDTIVEYAGDNASWVELTADLSAYAGTTIAIEIVGNHQTMSSNQYWNDILVDDFFIEETPNCPAPSSPTTSNLAATSTDLTWTENGTAAQWEVSYGASGFTAGTGTEVPATTASATLSGLTAETTYDVYVRAICAVGDTSSWSSATPFTTPCANEAVPYSQDFTTFLPSACWDEAGNSTPLTGPTSLGSGDWRSSGGAVRLNIYSAGDKEWVLTPGFDLGTGTAYQATFDFAIYSWNGTSPATPGSDDEFEFLISTDGGTTWTSLYTADVTYGTTGLSNPVIDLSSYSGVVQFAFYGTDGEINDAPDVDFYFDNFVIEEIPACPAPSALTASNVAGTSADLTWTENGTATEWEVSYGVSGFPVGSGTEFFVSAASASLSGLAANEVDYDVYVRSVCGVGDTSVWTAVTSFTTACSFYAAPYTMTFDNTSTPTCWTNAGGESWSWQTGSGFGAASYASTPGGGDHTGNSGAFAALDGSGTNPTSGSLATLTSPNIDLTGLTTPRLRFYVFSNNTNNPGDNATFYAIVSGTTDTIVEYSGDNASWVELTADLSAYAGTTIAIEIVGDHQTMSGSQYLNDILVDDFFIEETPNCFAPSALVFSNLTFSSVDIAWTDNNTPSSSLFEVSVGASGFTPGSTTSTYVTAPSESLTGLTMETTYDVYVRANCGTNSAWSSVASFTTPPSCYTATALSITNVTDASADLTWTDANNTPTPLGYEVSIGASGFTAGSGTETIVTATSESFSGLTQSTGYDVYVRSICAIGDTSAWTSVVSFTTLRTPPAVAQGVTCTSGGSASAVFSESFESTLTGWTGDYGTGNGNWEVPDGASSTGTGASTGYNGSGDYMNYEASATTANQGTIVSPAIDLSVGADDAELSFWMHAYGADMGTLNVGVGTTATGPFTTEFTWTGQLQTSASDAWVNVGVDLSSYVGSTIYIAFTQYDTVTGNQYAGDMCIDEMTVTTCLACAIPSALTASNVAPTSADLTWTENGTATEWEVSYGASGFTAGAGTEVPATTASATLSGLTAQTDYDVYVRSVCGVGDTSDWSPVASFTTPCANEAVPYSQDFTTFLPSACWDEAGNGTPATGPTGLGFGDWRSSGGAVRLNIYSAGDKEWVLTPSFDLGTGTAYQATFDFAIYSWNGTSPATPGSDDEFEFLISTDGGTTWTSLYTADVNYGTTGLSNQVIDLTSYSGVVQFAFYGTDGAVTDAPDVDFYFDNFVIEEVPACPAPSALTTSNVAPTSADLTWTENGTATEWEVSYGASGFTAGAGTEALATTTSATFSGLTAQTDYSVYVRAICAVGDTSPWSSVSNFTTPCANEAVPYSQDFTTFLPSACWDEAGNGTPATGPTGLGSGDWRSSGGAVRLNIYSAGDKEWVLTPSFDLGTGTAYQATFDFAIYSWNGTSPATPGSDDEFEFLISTDGGTTWTSLYTADVNYGTTGLSNQVIDLTSYSGVVQFAFYGTDGAVNDAPDVDLYFDNFVIEEIPSCPAPSALTASNVASDTADLTWTENGTATEWEVSYGASGFTAGAGTEVPTTSASATLSGLSGGTNYDVYVRAICAVGDTSPWSAVASFTSACSFYAAPYTMTFDNTSTPTCWTNAGGESWSWQTGSGFGAAAYASTPGGGDHTGNSGAFAALDGSGTNPTSGSFATLTSPNIDLTGLTTPRLRFFVFSNNTNLPGDNATFYAIVSGTTDTIVEYAGDDASWVELTADLSAYAGTTIAIEIVGNHQTMSSNQYWNDLLVDDFFIEETPSCFAPTAVTFSNITATTVDVTITDPQVTAIEWIVDYGVGNTSGFNASFTSLTGQLTSLTPQTTYDLVVTTTCDGPFNSSTTSVYNFTTGCGAQAVPYTEDFTTFLPDACWDEAGSNSLTGGPANLGAGDWRGSSGAARMNSYQNLDQEWLLTPSFDLGTGTPYQVEFDFGIFGYNNTTPATCGSDDEFQFLISTDGGTTWSALFTANNTFATSAGGNRQFLDLTSYSGTVQFAFYATDGTTDDPQDVDFYVDNFAIQPFATCISPTIISGSASGATQASVGFIDNNATPSGNYEIEYGLTGYRSTLAYSYAVTASSMMDYTIAGSDRNGSVSGDDPSITVYVGDTMRFDINSGSTHPFVISSVGTLPSSPVSGVINNGAVTDTVTWIPSSAGTYYYICNAHPDMVGTIVVVDDSPQTVSGPTSPITISGLTELTSYDAYVRTNCGGGDVSNWVGPTSFTTSRTPPAVAQGVTCTSGGSAVAIFSESFESTLTGWTGDYGTGNGNWEVPDGASSTGTGASTGYNGSGDYMNYEASATTANQGTIVSPAIDLSVGADDAELSFWMHAYGDDMGTLNVGVGTTATGPFTTEFTWTGQLQTSASDAWVNVGVDLSSYVGSTIYIAFTQYDTVTGNQYAGDMCIDEMTVTTCVACAVPSALTASNLAPTSADLTWTENGTATEWEVSYGASGFTAGAGTEVPATSASATLSGLTAQTDYDVYVRSVCGVGDTSDWSAVASFTTPCLAAVAPYLEDFNAGLLPNCWSLSATSGGGWVFTGTPGYAAAGNGRTSGSYAWIDHSGTDAGVVIQVVDVDISALTTPRLSFDYFHYSSGSMFSPNELFVEAWDGAAWNNLTTLSNDISGWNNYAADLSSSAYSGSLVRIRFRAESGGDFSDYEGDQLIDNISFEETPSCFDVTSLAASATSSSSIEVSFVDVNATAPANGYIVTYDDGNGAQSVSSNPTASPFTISGLTANTPYTITVQADCGGGDLSPNALSVTATTACGNEAVPYSQDFTTFLPSACWDEAGNGTPATGPTSLGSGDWRSSGGAVRLNIYSAGDKEWVLTPGFDLGTGTAYQATFDFAIYSWNGTSPATPGSDDEFEFLISTDGGTTWTSLYTADVNYGTTGLSNQVIDLTSYSGVVQFAFYGTDGAVNDAPDVDFYFDNFVIEEIPACIAPSALTASNVAPTSADLTWTENGTATEWEVSYGASGFTAGAGTEVPATSASATLSGLTAEATYDVYVRAICAVGDTSAWSAVESFTTPCAFITPAYIEDFAAGYLPTSCWSQGTGGSPTTGPSSTGSSGWGSDGLANAGFSGAARINIYSSSGTDWLITPTFDLSSGGPWEANFDVAVVAYAQTTPSSLDANNDFGLYASTDGGSTWTAVWSADENYVTNPGGNNETVDLSTYTGTVQFAFYAASNFGAADNDVSVDNFAIQVQNSNYTWSGASNTDWSDNANWVGGTAPSAATDVVIVPSATNDPSISATQAVGDLTVADNVTVSLSSGASLEVNGDASLGSGSAFTGDGTLSLSGGNSGTSLSITGSATIENLVIESNYSLSSGILNITGGLTLDGGDFTGGINVVLNSDANGTAYLDDFSGSGGTYNGQITCQLFVPGTTGIQHLISSPVSTPNLTELADDLSGYGSGLTGTDGVAVTPTATCDPTALDPSSNYGNMFEWSASTAQNIACPQQGGWIVRSAGSMDNARGYSAYLTGSGATLDMSGTPNSGDVTINMAALAITNNTAMSNWDILGNPYPSGLDRDALITGNNFPVPGSPSGSFGLNSISYWNPSGTYSGTYAPYLPGDVIASFQGFSANWDASGTNPTITYSNSMRSTATGTWRSVWYNERIDVELRGNGFADRTIIVFADDATNGFDAMYDAEKFASASGQPTLYTGSTEHYALNSLAADAYGQSIPMGVIAGADGYFEFDFSTVENLPNGSMLYLEDLATGTWTNVSENPVYGFNMLATDASDRFILHFTPEVTATAVDGTCENADAYIELTFDGYQIAGQDVAWNYAVSKEGMAQAQGSMVSTIAIPVSESGIYNVDFTFGNATVNEVLSINVPVAPTAAIPAEVALSENEAITLNGMFTNANSYEWAVDGVVFSTEANPTWTASTEGIYNIAVTVRSEDGCSASDNMVAEVSKSVTSINDVNAVFQITQDAYSVVVLMDAEGFMIEMIAMDGKLVASARASQGANVLSTQALAAGVYEVRLSSANGVVGSQKVLVK